MFRKVPQSSLQILGVPHLPTPLEQPPLSHPRDSSPGLTFQKFTWNRENTDPLEQQKNDVPIIGKSMEKTLSPSFD